jgi:hypothetical protein
MTQSVPTQKPNNDFCISPLSDPYKTLKQKRSAKKITITEHAFGMKEKLLKRKNSFFLRENKKRPC